MVTLSAPWLAAIPRAAATTSPRVRRGGRPALGTVFGSVMADRFSVHCTGLGAYLAARRITDPVRARSVAFASIVATQLGHTLDLGRIEGRLSGPVVGAVAASAAVTVASLAVPGLQGFLGLAVPGPLAVAIVLAATLGAVGLARALPGATTPAASGSGAATAQA
jgi:hypothetical protein